MSNDKLNEKMAADHAAKLIYDHLFTLKDDYTPLDVLAGLALAHKTFIEQVVLTNGGIITPGIEAMIDGMEVFIVEASPALEYVDTMRKVFGKEAL
jgi:hypothetical protein